MAVALCRRRALAAKKFTHGVCEMFLKPQDQALAFRDLLRCSSRPLQPSQLGDVCAQMSHQPIYGPLVCHEVAEPICTPWVVAGAGADALFLARAGRIVCTRPVSTS